MGGRELHSQKRTLSSNRIAEENKEKHKSMETQ